MRVTLGNSTQQLVEQLSRSSSELYNLQHQVGGSSTIQKPSDNPTDAARLSTIESTKNLLEQYRSNLNDAQDIITISDSHLAQFNDLHSEAQSIAIQSENIILDPQMREAFARQIDGMIETAFQLINSKHDNQFLYGGKATTTEPFTATRDANGSINQITYGGTVESNLFRVADGISVSPFLDGDTNEQLGGVINQMIAVRDAINSNDQETIQAESALLRESEDDIVNAVGTLASKAMRLDIARNKDDGLYLNLEKQRSEKADANLEETVIKLNNAQIAYQAALQSSTMIMRNSILDYV